MNAGFVYALLALSMNFLASSAFAALVIEVDKSAQTLTVSRDGETLHSWPVSTGKSGYATPSGNFTAFRMEAEHYSKEWDDAPMPHSVFFTKRGHAIHGSYHVKRLGSPASHGCVRLAPDNAAKLFALVKEEGLPNTQVILTGSEQIALERKKTRAASNDRRPPDRQSERGRADGCKKRAAPAYRARRQCSRFLTTATRGQTGLDPDMWIGATAIRHKLTNLARVITLLRALPRTTRSRPTLCRSV